MGGRRPSHISGGGALRRHTGYDWIRLELKYAGTPRLDFGKSNFPGSTGFFDRCAEAAIQFSLLCVYARSDVQKPVGWDGEGSTSDPEFIADKVATGACREAIAIRQGSAETNNNKLRAQRKLNYLNSGRHT
jgi:hypothetical protein